MKLRTILFLILTISFSGCANYGGGTIGTGMSLGSGKTKPINTGISYINLTGRLLSALEQPIENATVNISTSKSEETVESDFDGRFIITLVAKVGEQAKIKINNGTSTYADTLTINEENIEHGVVDIKLLTNGKLKLTGLRWYR